MTDDGWAYDGWTVKAADRDVMELFYVRRRLSGDCEYAVFMLSGDLVWQPYERFGKIRPLFLLDRLQEHTKLSPRKRRSFQRWAKKLHRTFPEDKVRAYYK